MIALQGEISNFRPFQASGHWYFTIKDQGAQIAAAMFRGANRRVPFTPEDGMSVQVQGQISIYEPRGNFQIIVQSMEPLGAGALHLAFEKLKARLQAEGLFDARRKRPLPIHPRRVAVVTSRDGAALRDILRIMARRHGGVSVVVVPARVQGAGAAAEIAAAVARAARLPGVDVLIVGRGGGSLEDLWAFNEEIVARALAECPLPVISAVGHETDVTIADFVADVRAPTPSAAAEMVVASRLDLLERIEALCHRLAGATRLLLSRLGGGAAASFPLRGARLLDGRLRRTAQHQDEMEDRLARAYRRGLEERGQGLAGLTARLTPRSLMARLARQQQRLHVVMARAEAAGSRGLMEWRQRLAVAAGRLQELSPLAVLERGYALARMSASGEMITNAGQVPRGAQVSIQLHRGRLEAAVTESIPGPAGTTTEADSD